MQRAKGARIRIHAVHHLLRSRGEQTEPQTLLQCSSVT